MGVQGAECVQCVLGGCECVCHMCHVHRGCAMGVQWACGVLSEYRAWWECGGMCVTCVICAMCVVGVQWVCNRCAKGVRAAECVGVCVL